MIDVAFDKTAVIELGDQSQSGQPAQPNQQPSNPHDFLQWDDEKLERYYTHIWNNPVVNAELRDRIAAEVQRRREQRVNTIPQQAQPSAPSGVAQQPKQQSDLPRLGDPVIARGLKVKGLEKPTSGKFEGILTTSRGQKYALFISNFGNAFIPFDQIGQYLVKSNTTNVVAPGVQANLRF